MMVPGLPPLVQIEDNTLFSRASVNAICVPSARLPVPSIGDGSAGEPAVPFEVLDAIHDRIEAVLRGVEVSPVTLAWLVPTRMVSMSRLSSRPFSIS